MTIIHTDLPTEGEPEKMVYIKRRSPNIWVSDWIKKIKIL